MIPTPWRAGHPQDWSAYQTISWKTAMMMWMEIVWVFIFKSGWPKAKIQGLSAHNKSNWQDLIVISQNMRDISLAEFTLIWHYQIYITVCNCQDAVCISREEHSTHWWNPKYAWLLVASVLLDPLGLEEEKMSTLKSSWEEFKHV